MIAYLEVVHAKATCPEVDSAMVACSEDACPGVTCPGVAQAKTVARKVFESGGELLHYEGQKSVNLPCNTTNTDWTPECNRVEEKSLEEMIMSVNVISASGCENKIRTRGEYENFDTVFI